MVHTKLLFFFSLIFLHLVALTFAHLWQTICLEGNGSFTANNSVYRSNLKFLLSSISSSPEIEHGYYSSSYGQDFDKAFAIALCRGDVTPNICRSCVNTTSNFLTQACPTFEAIIWHEHCMIRYSNQSELGIMEYEPSIPLDSGLNRREVNEFGDSQKYVLLDRLKRQAASGDYFLKFATGEEPASNIQTIYALVQCTPNLSKEDCSRCLSIAIQRLPECCEKENGGVYSPSCNIRYENQRFYGPFPSANTTEPNATTEPNGTPGPKGNNSQNVIIITVSIVAFVVFSIGIGLYLRVRKASEKYETVDEISRPESIQFNFDTIRLATDNFSHANKLGQGGFGAVYKGTLSNGQEIAVKRLSMNSRQGEVEFKNEVLLVAKLQHRNLVRLLGFCLEREERLLVYEFVPNSSLNNFLFDPIKRVNLDWEMRHRIIIGIARGLVYLHEDSRLLIIHRDLKAGNILLDAQMNPKISDFGLAKLFTADQTQHNTDRIAGTLGYMAPEYVRGGHFSVKSDVFSYGVLLLEIVSGEGISRFRIGNEGEHLLTYAWKNWKEGNASNIIDPALKVGSRSEVIKCINIGLLCVQENEGDRPTMNAVVAMFNSNFDALPKPSRPGFFMHNNVNKSKILSSLEYQSEFTNSDQPKRKTVILSINEVSMSEFYPR